MNKSDNRGCVEMFLIGVLLVLTAFILSRYECCVKADIQGYDWDFGLVKGCMVKHNGHWIDYKLLRYQPEE